MALEDLATTCPGCKATFETGRGLMSHIHQTSQTRCRQIFDQYVELSIQFDNQLFVETDSSHPQDDLVMEDFETYNDEPMEDVPDSPIDLSERVDEHLPGLDSEGDEIEAELWVDADDIDVEVTSAIPSLDEEEDEDYLWHVK